jgi:hypothetical protein
MSTKREDILAAIATSLAGVSGVSGRVYRSRQEAFSRAESPSIIIEPMSDRSSPATVSTARIDWTMAVAITVFARGLVPDQVADPVVQAIHAALMVDRSIGGLAMDLWPLAFEPQFDKGDLQTVWAVCSYQVRYRTAVTTLAVT